MSVLRNAFAVVIGIARYRFINSLPSVVAQDASDIHVLLKDPQRCGYPPQQSYLLLDGEATQVAIRDILSLIAQQANTTSTVFIYFSGHGGRLTIAPYADEYLLPVDTRFDSAHVLAKTAISGSEFTSAIRAIRAERVVVVFDCCHAGGIGQPKQQTNAQFKQGFTEQYYDMLQTGVGRVIFASSRDTEISYVLPNARNSLFTQFLLAGLRGGAAGEDGAIRIFDLFRFVQPRVTAQDARQHPLLKATVEQDFPIALYLGGKYAQGTVVRALVQPLRVVLARIGTEWELLIENVSNREVTSITLTLHPPHDVFLNTRSIRVARLAPGDSSTPHALTLYSAHATLPLPSASPSVDSIRHVSMHLQRQLQLQRKITELQQQIDQLEQERDLESGIARMRLSQQIQQQHTLIEQYEQELAAIAAKQALSGEERVQLHNAQSAPYTSQKIILPFTLAYRADGGVVQSIDSRLSVILE